MGWITRLPLIMLARGKGLTVSGLAMIPRPIDPGSVLTYSATISNREEWAAVEACWHDRASGQRQTVTEGKGSPVKKLRHLHATKDEAARAAKAALDETARGATTPCPAPSPVTPPSPPKAASSWPVSGPPWTASGP